MGDFGLEKKPQSLPHWSLRSAFVPLQNGSVGRLKGEGRAKALAQGRRLLRLGLSFFLSFYSGPSSQKIGNRPRVSWATGSKFPACIGNCRFSHLRLSGWAAGLLQQQQVCNRVDGAFLSFQEIPLLIRQRWRVGAHLLTDSHPSPSQIAPPMHPHKLRQSLCICSPSVGWKMKCTTKRATLFRTMPLTANPSV